MANQRASYLAEERSRRRKSYTHRRVNLSIVTARCAPSRATLAKCFTCTNGIVQEGNGMGHCGTKSLRAAFYNLVTRMAS